MKAEEKKDFYREVKMYFEESLILLENTFEELEEHIADNLKRKSELIKYIAYAKNKL